MGSKQRTTAAFLIMLGLAGCGKGGTERAKAQPPLVKVATPATHRFVDRIEAVGTARANEQVTLASPVTERIERLHFDDGGYVARGQVIAVLAQGQEQASLAGALAAERQAKAQLGRIESLTGRGFVTRASLEQQTAAAQQARATADDARAQISDRVIRAPFGGYVSLRTISEGAIVGAGTVIATVSDVSRIKLDFSVPETMLASLRKGQALDATAAAFPGRAFHGVVATIDPVIDPTTRAVLVRALLPNPDRALKPGMLLTVRVDAATRQAASLPELAIVGEGSERYVYTVGKDNKAARAAVTTGLRDNGLVEVRGLPAGARVIVEGVVKVSDGARVRVQGDAAPRTGS